ncbi:cryptochrome/photolyase family protein [Tenacibaculum jejuense]|uniref:Putative deoxyribodipyrimidine photolyase n=1 Tax=Tenacibaculum jejuense TaxID=584609 RepID=A0A238U9X2_9FLAO|nr:cryptochrome/photolyase family protein [Tenacibaculum jejuense]SNR15875.1 Putative deoxyribodipyrimidine photolyase [Tenacibaculum jejuense]
MKAVSIIFPHQLFKSTTHISKENEVYLVEEYLFFKQYAFHKQKLAFHRATMQFYKDFLNEKGYQVTYVESTTEISDIRNLLPQLIEKGYKQLYFINPTDNWLEKRIHEFENEIELIEIDNSLFINTKDELTTFFKASKKKFFQTSFYKKERLGRNILITNEQPVGGKWTFDTDNRKKYPKGKTPPQITFPDANKYYLEAKKYIEENFSDTLGEIDKQQLYPLTYEESENWLEQFFEVRFHEFGIYEDAIVKDKHFLNHSILSPLINVGLLSPLEVIKKAIDYAAQHEIPINSLEGFVRQILGWREFIRGIYEVKGTEERTKNFWNHSRKIPASFYEGTTGILPIDTTIKKILKTGYAHHIERLMILGNFMLLCEFDPDEVYRWFMELFIDAYDWVMVPNVYGMSLFADGGLMSTKPYISSSNYIKKMSDYSNGEWQKIWDGLFWRFMHTNREFLSKNPRLNMLIRNLDKMGVEKREEHFSNAEHFLDNLDNKKEFQLNLL